MTRRYVASPMRGLADADLHHAFMHRADPSVTVPTS
jgi:hypothetical protein